MEISSWLEVLVGALGFFSVFLILGTTTIVDAGQCNLRVIQVDASTGCTLTRANILGMTPQMFEDQGFKEVRMDRVIAQAKEAKMAGVRENTLEDLLMSRLTPIRKPALNTTSVDGSQSVILPYIFRNQKRQINSNYFAVDAGAATPGRGSNGIPAHAWDLTVKKSTSPFATSLPGLEKYFLPGRQLLVQWYNAGTNVSYSAPFKILGSVNADAGGVYKATLTLEPAYSENGWGGLSSDSKAKWEPTVGTVLALSNSISDFESWCYQDPAENVRKLLTFWMQTSRRTFEYNDEWLKALVAPNTSDYFKKFRQLSLAEAKRIQAIHERRTWLNSVMFGDRINEFQTPETYASLPQVVDPLNPSCVLEYKANALGFYTLLNDCSRVYDHQGTALDLNRLFESGYFMARAREASGGSIDTIDWLTDRWTADAILVKMIPFFKTKYGYDVTKTIQQGEPLKFNNQVVLKYNSFQLPPALGGYTAAFFWHEYFDDRLVASAASVSGAAPTGDAANRARFLFALDFSDIELGIVGTSSADRQTNVADHLYNCVIKPNVRHYKLNSTTWVPIIEDPTRHEITHNFSHEIADIA